MSLSCRPKAGAELLGVSLAQFWRLTKRADFPAKRKISPRCSLYDHDELIAWRDGQVETTEAASASSAAGRKAAMARHRPNTAPTVAVKAVQ